MRKGDPWEKPAQKDEDGVQLSTQRQRCIFFLHWRSQKIIVQSYLKITPDSSVALHYFLCYFLHAFCAKIWLGHQIQCDSPAPPPPVCHTPVSKCEHHNDSESQDSKSFSLKLPEDSQTNLTYTCLECWSELE